MRTNAPSSDAALMRGLVAGGTEGFAAFYEQFAPALFSFACDILRDEKEAEGALQRAFVQMSRHSSSFDSRRGSLFSWAVMITRARALDRLRDMSSADVSVTNRISASSHGDGGSFTAALAALPAQPRETLELAFFGGLSPAEIADRLELPVDVVKGYLRSALATLRDAGVKAADSSAAYRNPAREHAADVENEQTTNVNVAPSRLTKEGVEAETFDSFVEKNFPPVYRFAFCMSLAPEAAAHLTNAAFAQAKRAQQHGMHPALDKQWLLTTVHHDWLANRSRPDADAPSQSAPPRQSLLDARHVAGLNQAVVLETVHGMDEDLRLVLSLFYFEKLSYGEIAVILELAPTTVPSHLSEAKTVLRQQLEQKRVGDRTLAQPSKCETVDLPVHKRRIRILLASFRPGTDDATDPAFREALDLLEHDAELATWFRAEQEFDAAMLEKFREVSVDTAAGERIRDAFKASDRSRRQRSAKLIPK